MFNMITWQQVPRWHLFFCSTDVSNSPWPHELQHTRFPCPSQPPGVYSNSSPSSLWFHPSNSSVFPVFSCLQSFPASGSFLMCQLFISAGPRLELQLQLQHQSFQWILVHPLGWTGVNSLLFKEILRVFSNTTVQKHQFFSTQPALQSSSHIHTWLLEKKHSLDQTERCWQSNVSAF